MSAADDTAGKRADELEREAGDMQRRSERLEHEIGDVRGDWQRKRSASDVPGAVPPEPDEPERAGDEPERPGDEPATEAPSERAEPREESPSEPG
jgi:hypothetical protein